MQREVSPIPPGRYWIIVDGPGNIADFDAWLADMRGAVRVETASLDQRGSSSSAFIIFVVPPDRAPFMSAAQFGFPNFAGPEVTSRQDVVQRPAPEKDPLDRIPDPLDAAKNFAGKLETGFLVLLVLLALRR